jgi:hypothetical protein
MSAEELKSSLHVLIDTCEDKIILEGIYKILQATQKPGEKDWWQGLDDEDKQLLEESMAQYKSGNYKSHDEIVKKAQEWLKK